MEWAFLALSPPCDKLLVFGDGWDYFALIFNGADSLAVTGRDMAATWRSISAFCRERDWSLRRLLHELRQETIRYRTHPPGILIDWWDPNVERSLNLDRSEVTILRGAKVSEPFLLGLDKTTVAIELRDDEIPLQLVPVAAAPAAASVKWARKTTRRLLTEGKIPEKARKIKAEFARLLEAESQKAVKAGQLSRALKASYLENQLGKDEWGIWPLNSFK
jgi:hypothetical protein